MGNVDFPNILGQWIVPKNPALINLNGRAWAEKLRSVEHTMEKAATIKGNKNQILPMGGGKTPGFWVCSVSLILNHGHFRIFIPIQVVLCWKSPTMDVKSWICNGGGGEGAGASLWMLPGCRSTRGTWHLGFLFIGLSFYFPFKSDWTLYLGWISRLRESRGSWQKVWGWDPISHFPWDLWGQPQPWEELGHICTL